MENKQNRIKLLEERILKNEEKVGKTAAATPQQKKLQEKLQEQIETDKRTLWHERHKMRQQQRAWMSNALEANASAQKQLNEVLLREGVRDLGQDQGPLPAGDGSTRGAAIDLTAD